MTILFLHGPPPQDWDQIQSARFQLLRPIRQREQAPDKPVVQRAVHMRVAFGNTEAVLE